MRCMRLIVLYMYTVGLIYTRRKLTEETKSIVQSNDHNIAIECQHTTIIGIACTIMMACNEWNVIKLDIN